jgi:hypothetical protein
MFKGYTSISICLPVRILPNPLLNNFDEEPEIKIFASSFSFKALTNTSHFGIFCISSKKICGLSVGLMISRYVS